jgi:hypothetical protein
LFVNIQFLLTASPLHSRGIRQARKARGEVLPWTFDLVQLVGCANGFTQKKPPDFAREADGDMQCYENGCWEESIV